MAEATLWTHCTFLSSFSVLVPAVWCFPRVVRVNAGPGFSGRKRAGAKTILSQFPLDLLALVASLGMSVGAVPQFTPHFPMIGAVVHYLARLCMRRCIEWHGWIVHGFWKTSFALSLTLSTSRLVEKIIEL